MTQITKLYDQNAILKKLKQKKFSLITLFITKYVSHYYIYHKVYHVIYSFILTFNQKSKLKNNLVVLVVIQPDTIPGSTVVQ